MPLELVALLSIGLFAGAGLDPAPRGRALLARWGRLHAVRSVASGVAFLLLGLHRRDL